jgi:predicted nucleotidyltransferase
MLEVAMNIGKETFETIATIAKEYGATQLILFGSALENPAEAKDIDLACGGVTGWKLFELAAHLENTLHITLDLIPLTPSSRFTRHIESHGKRLL